MTRKTKKQKQIEFGFYFIFGSILLFGFIFTCIASSILPQPIPHRPLPSLHVYDAGINSDVDSGFIDEANNIIRHERFCNDGTRAHCSGRGCCSHHGGLR